jgi:hypothetical protein
VLLFVKLLFVSNFQTSKSRIGDEKGSASKKSKLDSGKGKSVDPMLDYYLHVPGNTVDRLASAAASKKMEYYLGCDWLHEISITIRRTKQTNIPNERLECPCFKLKACNIMSVA